MSFSFCLLTATWLASAPPAPETGAPVPTPATDARLVPAVPAPELPPARPWRFGDRIRSLFSRRTPEAPPEPTAPAAKPPTPVVISEKPAQPGAPPAAALAPPQKPAQQTPAQQIPAPQTPVPVPHVVGAGPRDLYPVSEKDLEKAGHEKDYSWITGRLVRVGGDRWAVRYAGPYEEDRYGGVVLLAPHADLTKHHEGDLVCVNGHVEGGRAPRPFAAVYQIQSIHLIEQGRR